MYLEGGEYFSLYNIHHDSESKIYGNKVEIYHLKAQITLEE